MWVSMRVLRPQGDQFRARGISGFWNPHFTQSYHWHTLVRWCGMCDDALDAVVDAMFSVCMAEVNMIRRPSHFLTSPHHTPFHNLVHIRIIRNQIQSVYLIMARTGQIWLRRMSGSQKLTSETMVHFRLRVSDCLADSVLRARPE